MKWLQSSHAVIIHGTVLACLLGTLPLQAQRMQDVAVSDVSAFKTPGYDVSPVPATSSVPTPREGVHKIPVVAWVISFAVPGGGQVYNGQWGKAIPMFIMGTAGTVAMLSACTQTDYYGGTVCSDSQLAVAGAGAVVFLASWIWSQIDAPIAAGSINRRNAAAVQIAPKVVPLRPAVPPSMAGYSGGATRTDRGSLGLRLATMTF